MKTVILRFVLFLELAGAALAADFGDLYDDATLKKWQPSFEEDLMWNFQNAILPKLTPEEKTVLRKVKIEVPLRGPDQGLFEFYATKTSVVMPALSLRFFGDLSLAYAWLSEKNYNIGTVQQYVGMIHYRGKDQFAGGRYPKPLEALHIPANVREDTGVADIFGKAFTSGMIFILCHELGHVYHHHPGYEGVTMAQARANEAEADRFAVEIMRRVGVMPAGAPLWFASVACVEAHRVDFSSDDAWQKHLRQRTHPVTADRIESLASAIDEAAPDFSRTQNDPARGLVLARYVAGEVRKIAEILKDEGVHSLFRQQSMTTEPKMLAPRRGVAFTTQAAKEKFTDEPFSGVFECEFGSDASKESIGLRLVLRRRGEAVTGDYSYGVAAGQVRGQVDGTTLYLDWTQGNARGKARFEWAGDGRSFTGKWGNRDSRDDGGGWSGRRL